MKKNILKNNKFFYEDKLGKTRAFYYKNQRSVLNTEIVEGLKLISSEGRKTMRICLHSSVKDKLHNMIIIDYKNNPSIPHFHRTYPESHHVIEGKLGVFLFDRNGKLKSNYVLSKSNNILDRLGSNECHLLLPVSDLTIYHETNIGSFNRKNPDMHIPKWFSNMNEKEKEKFYSYLYKKVLKK